MSSIDLTQEEAGALIEMEKHTIDEKKPWDFPGLGGKINIPLIGVNKRENFFLDISRGKINLQKGNYQNRAQVCITLIRLDFNGPAHRNPNGEEIQCPHLHLYREGFGLKWAFEVPEDKFKNLSDLWILLEDFMNYCNITRKPNIVKGLFI